MEPNPAPSSQADAGLQRICSERHVIGRPWPKGTSGNPSGKRKGCVSLAAALKRSLTKDDAVAIVRKLIELAKAGDLPAMKLIFERLDTLEVERRIAELEAFVERQNANQNPR